MAIDREKVVQAALKFAEKKRYDKAIIEYQRIIQEDPNDARTLLKVGDLQLKMEAYPAAIETYERVGKHYAQQGFALKAIAVYKQIRDIVSKHIPQQEERYGHILPKLAELYQQLGLTSDALSAYDEVATRLLKQGRDKDAIGVFKKIVDLDPTNPLPHLRLAEALARAKEVDGAIEQFSEASEILLRLGRRDDALKVVDRLLQIRPDVDFAKRAARLYLERAQPNDGLLALAKLQTAFQANSKDLETLGLLARAFEQIGQRPKAIEVQKELARLAKDQGNMALFQETVDHLSRVAPNDDAVRALARQLKPSIAPSMPPPSTVSVVSISTSDISVEEIESLEAESEAPFELSRHSRPSFAPPPYRAPSDMVEVSEGMEAAEDLHEHPSGGIDPERYAEQSIADAIAFRQARLPNKAIEVLRIALEVLPGSVPLRAELRDVLLEIGDENAAIGEMITLSAIAIDTGDTDSAVQMLSHVLALVPDHARASEMLASLGYGGLEPVEDSRGGAAPNVTSPDPFPAPQVYELDYPADSVRQQLDSFDPDMPLPSYDLEEVQAAELLSTGEVAAIRGFEDTDDPFGEGAMGAPAIVLPSASLPAHDALPTFHIDEDDPSFRSPDLTEEEEAIPRARSQLPTAPGEIPQQLLGEAQPQVLGGTKGFQGGDSIEDALEEVDFFATRGLYDDARAILDEQLARAPNHPLVQEKLRELEELAEAAGLGRAPERTAVSAIEQPGFDVGASLDALDDAFEPMQEARPQFKGEDDQVDVEAVFAKFKEGVKAQVEDNDSATHYDLGVAYKEMGLIADSINEFRLAARDPARECVCLSMVGVIELERGNLEAAADAFIKALNATERTVEQELSLYYELGAIFEAKQNNAEALYYFRKIQRKDPQFRDVGDRIRELEGMSGERPKSLHPETDFDAVFDDILGGSKLP